MLTDPVCPWVIQDSGAIVLGGRCTGAPRRFLIDDPYGRVTLYDQQTVTGNDLAGRVATVPGAPRVRAVVQIPCPAAALREQDAHRGAALSGAFAPSRVCLPAMTGQFFLDTPGTLIATFRGGRTAQTVTVGRTATTIAPGRLTRVHVQVARGASSVQLALSWHGAEPRLVSAVLVQGPLRTPLL